MFILTNLFSELTDDPKAAGTCIVVARVHGHGDDEYTEWTDIIC